MIKLNEPHYDNIYEQEYTMTTNTDRVPDKWVNWNAFPSPTWFEFEEANRVNREPKDSFKEAFNSMYDRGVIANG